jgi:hypothetical protein
VPHGRRIRRPGLRLGEKKQALWPNAQAAFVVKDPVVGDPAEFCLTGLLAGLFMAGFEYYSLVCLPFLRRPGACDDGQGRVAGARRAWSRVLAAGTRWRARFRSACWCRCWWCELAQAAATARAERSALLFAWDVLGHRRLREGAADQACQHYARLEATVHQMGIGEPCLPPWPRHAISAYLAAGRVTDAERVLAWLDRSTQRLPCRFPRIAAAAGRARLAEARGDRDTARARFRDALALHQQVNLPVEHAETLDQSGDHQPGRGCPRADHQFR